MPDDPKADPQNLQWRVIHCRPRCEKKLAEYATVHSVNHYLPLRRETRIYQRRRVTFDNPLFPGYLFAACDSDSLTTLLTSHQVVRTLEVVDQAHFAFELDQIRRALTVDPTLGAFRMVQRQFHIGQAQHWGFRERRG